MFCREGLSPRKSETHTNDPSADGGGTSNPDFYYNQDAIFAHDFIRYYSDEHNEPTNPWNVPWF
ncbi:hypothetical protein QC761_0030110 [Podospora bellae-mahoneyi]|uniref:Uncharacterized protein n=1 Tax=Podospora bellae-mahoneyi TaxID=2093777 RepID=A0ABR0FMM6_9PEZI|nr:hypothetical protein QC761_0030110 [Podospora bellae-mahoneyi]